jgi:hypothetical protein
MFQANDPGDPGTRHTEFQVEVAAEEKYGIAQRLS